MSYIALGLRTTTQAARTYTVTVYGYASASSAANVTLTDLAVMANLS